MIKRTATKIEKVIIETGLSGKSVNKIIGKDNPAAIEARDTYLKITSTNKNTIKDKPAICGSIAKAIPNRVATPFPPLKPAKSGNIWPNTAARPKAIW